MAGDDVTIVIRADSGDAVRAFRDVDGRLRDMRGRFVSESSIMSGAMRKLSGSIGSLIPVATAAVPLAAALGAATLKAGGAAAGAGVALGVFGAAVAGQVSSLSDASKAQTKYNEAVAEHGRGSQQAAKAAQQVQATFAGMPEATQRAAVSLGGLKDSFREFSDETAQFTMQPVEKSFVVLGELMPRLAPMVEGTSTQLERLVDVAGGAVASPGFDRLMDQFTEFANDSLKTAVDGIIHFSRALSEGEADGPVKAFMEFAQANGPAMRETLSSLGAAVTTLVEASAEAGPGMLSLVNAGLKLVAALPPELVATVMQLAVGLKLVTLAGAGAAAVSTGIAALGARITALRAASTAAGGGMAGLAAAFGTLGKAAKASIVVAGIAAVAMAVDKLSSIGEKAPPSVDKLTTALGELGRTGESTGYLADQFGKDFGSLKDQIDKVINPSVAESINNWGADITDGLLDSGDATEAFNKNMDAIDESLTNLVKGGNAELAKAALASMTEGMSPEQAEKFRSGLDGFDSALADVALEADLTADSMGMFGAAARDTSQKLAEQKRNADALRESIFALNDVNRSAHDAQTQFEQSVDDLTKSFKEHGATLNADTDAGRANRDAMSAVAASHDALIASGIAAGDTLGSMTKKSETLRSEMMRLATEAFDGNKAKATEYVNTLLGTPESIKTMIELERKDAIDGLQSVQEEIKKTPGAKSVTVETLSGAAIAALEEVGLKTRQLPDGRTEVSTKNGQSLGAIGAVLTALQNLNGRSATTFTFHKVHTEYSTSNAVSGGKSVNSMVGGYKRDAKGGRVRGYATGGMPVQFAPEGLLSGPGNGTSDSILAMFASGAVGRVSDTEFVVNAESTRKYLPLLEAINADKLRIPGFAKGGVTKKEAEARKAARGDLTISYFGQMAGYKNTEFAGALGKADSVGDLVSALNKWRSVIKQTTHGLQEAKLLKMLKHGGDNLLHHQKKLADVTKSLDKAKDKLDKLKDSAASLDASVKGGVISGFDITRAAGAEEGRVTINTLMSQARGDAAQAGAFADALKALKKKGVSGRVIEQIAEAGITGGGLETAQALLGADKKQIDELNKLNQSIRQSADDAGELAADAMYGAGIKAAEGLVKGLKKKEAEIERHMLKLAKSMEKSIKKALGIKSPSKVMEEIGGFTADGFALGIERNKRVRPAWESMLTPLPSHVARSTMPAGGSGGPREVVIRSGGSKMDDLIVEILRKSITTTGGGDPAFLGLKVR
jgi:hypothetical protein